MKRRYLLLLVFSGVILALGWLFRHEFERVYNQIVFLDDGVLIIDTFTNGLHLVNDKCDDWIESTDTIPDKEYWNIQSKTRETFFNQQRNIGLNTNVSIPLPGPFSSVLENGEARISIPVSCWPEEGINALTLSYATNKVIPRFKQAAIPVLEISGEFKLMVEIVSIEDLWGKDLRQGSFNSTFFPTDLDNWNYFQDVFISALKVDSPQELVFNLTAPRSVSPIDWNRVGGVKIIISGHGEIVLGPPKLSL